MKPLVLLTPKYLLHHRPATSALADFTVGTFFNRVIDDGKASIPKPLQGATFQQRLPQPYSCRDIISRPLSAADQSQDLYFSVPLSIKAGESKYRCSEAEI